MLRQLMNAAMLSAAMVVPGGLVATQAFAEVVYNRGNDTDPPTQVPGRSPF